MTKISLLLPTRQRPKQLKRLIDSAISTASQPDSLEFVVYIDDDDNSYDNLDLDTDWISISGPRLHDGLVNLSAKWNTCYSWATGDILMHCGDDIVFRTYRWDKIVRETFASYPDNILFAYGYDGYQDAIEFGTHGFIRRDWVEAVGYFVPPYFVSDYNDTFLNDVAKQIGRHERVPIETEHMHYICGKAEIDLNTRERLERHEQNDPRALYYSEKVQSELATAVDKLNQVISAASETGNKA